MSIHVLQIQGMTCNHCVQKVTKELQSVAGVRCASVDLAGQSARIEHEATAGVGALVAAVQQAGFQVSGFKEERS